MRSEKMKYTNFKDSLRKDDPEFNSRVKAENLRVEMPVAIAQKRAEEEYSQKVIANIAHLTQQ
jgi:hypothetical protein